MPEPPDAIPSTLIGARERAVTDVVLDVIARRAASEAIDDRTLIEAHPELAPELCDRLRAVRAIHRAALHAPPATATEPEPTLRQAIRGYTLDGELGAGAQGVVYAAVQESTGRRVAVKIVAGGPLLTSLHRARVDREVAVLASVDHPNVVRVTDRGRTADGSFYFAMDLIDGLPLDEWLAVTRSDPGRGPDEYVREVLRVIRTTALAAHEVHELGIVHRDLKPSNVRVDRHGAPHILDFGFARLSPVTGDAPGATAATMTGQIIGSLPWASPEQAAGRVVEVGPASDVYALAVMLYHGLAGDFPYPVVGSVAEVVANITTRSPSRAARLDYYGRRRPFPGQLWALLERALAKAPGLRYPTALAFAEDIERFLDGRPVMAGVGPTAKRRQRIFATVLATVGLSVVVAVAAVYLRPPPFEPFDRPSFTNAMGMAFIRVGATPVTLGSPFEELGREQNENETVVRVDRPYWIGTTEVTRGQYRSVMGDLPPGAPQVSDDNPVTAVTHAQAEAFCRELSARDGRTYRLPREAEWELACRAGMTGPFAGTGVAEDVAWFAANAKGALQPVARRTPNHWRIFDMHGNAAEWCADAYGPRHPTDRSADLRMVTRVVRGGSVADDRSAIRSAARRSRFPGTADSLTGFRVVAEDRLPESP
ncbi:MAG TPA: bifunctional serine/threonine-protein kinase/formylglycine-generating enzyme family protein [Tepidisphaeraceae bacterium]|jgi:formylglycine-generating enzyme required for sulfatase activity|nr:bifunctional serine/threonine-protein kinase/formylglycine-generating enzyme family protein [Tepidisphaeraceae bacterium]